MEQPNTNKTHIASTCKRVSGPSGLKICCLNINSYGYDGGVALYIHNSISYKCRNDIIVREIEALPVDIKISNSKSITVVTLYRPEGPVEIFDHVETLISRIDSENKECIIIGDTNCNLLSEFPDNSTKHLT